MKKIILSAAVFLLTFASAYAQGQVDMYKAEAQKQMQFGRYGEAIDLLNKYVSAKPQIAEGYNLRGVCYEKRGQFEMAVYDFRSAKKLQPNNGEINANLKRAVDAWHALLYNKIEGHRREIAINPNKAVNYLEIGKSFKSLGEWATAEEWYDKYLEKEEGSADEIIRYSEILAKNNHLQKGLPILKAYTEKYPTDQRLWSRYGYFLLWSGQNKAAIESFEKALVIRPFFKEAQDGLDQARGKGYVYTVNDTSTSYNYGLAQKSKAAYYEYPIDKYTRMLKNNPNDHDTRIKLVQDLIKASRFEEAYEHLEKLSADRGDTEEFKRLWADVNNYKKKEYAQKISEYQAKISRDPYNKEAVLTLSNYYSYTKDFAKALNILENYLRANPNDMQVRYQYAQHLAWNKDFEKAMDEMDMLLARYPDSTNYMLMRAQLSVWTNESLDIAERLLQDVLRKNPNNLQALLALGSLHFQKNDLNEAEKYAGLIHRIDSENEDANRLKYSIELQRKRDVEADNFSLLQDARKMAFDKDCDNAIRAYKNYIESNQRTDAVYKELANAYVCAARYSDAIAIYDDLLKKEYDYELDKQRAKVYFWANDSVSALREFKKIVAKSPGDAEAKLYLGDAYMKMQQFESARKVFKEMLAAAPSSHILKQRMSWLPAEGSSIGGAFDTYGASFPIYFLVAPEAVFFADNLGFQYNLQGVSLEAGFTDFLSGGGSFYRGGLASRGVTLNMNMIKGNLYARFSELVSARASFGTTIIENNTKSPVIQLSVSAAEKDFYNVTAGLNKMTAAQIIYSPNLVNDLSAGNVVEATSLYLNGKYEFPSGFMLSGDLQSISVSDGNTGNIFSLRGGKKFDIGLAAGYEYYYTVFAFTSALYFSPSNYESHSLWGEWNVINNDEASVTVGGKMGMVPQSDFIIREVFGEASYKFSPEFSLSGRVTAGSSIQNQTGYSSTSFTIAAYWGL